MCDPITASIALTVAGTAAQAAGASKAKKAMNGAREAERIRQKGYQGEAEAVYNESKGNATKASQDAQQGKAEADRKGAYAKDVEAAKAPTLAIGDNLAGDQTAAAVVNDESAKESAKAAGFAGQQGDAKAALQGFSDLQFNNSIYNNHIGTKLGTLGNFMKGSADVLPYEMEAASHKGDGLNALGSVLQLGGTIAGVGAGAGWWGGTTPPPPTYVPGQGMPPWAPNPAAAAAAPKPWDFSSLLKK